MRVFIRTNDLGEDRPIICGYYTDENPVPIPEGMTLLTLPREAVGGPSKNSFGMKSLVEGWRELAGSMPVKAEAKRRIEEGFSSSDQLNALHDLLDSVMKYGIEVAKWPLEAKRRYAVFEEKWKYVAEIQAKVQEHAVMPRDPSSDKIWPSRLKKS